MTQLDGYLGLKRKEKNKIIRYIDYALLLLNMNEKELEIDKNNHHP
jgi:hypothetical protein